MPPPMPNPSKRMTANPAKPVGRYRPGKPVAEQESSDEDSEGSEQEQISQPQKRPAPRQPQSRSTQRQTRQAAESDEDDDDDEEGFVTDPEDEVTQSTPAASSESRRKQPSQPTSTLSDQKSTTVTQRLKRPDSDAEDSEQGSESEEEESEESSEESSSSEEEAPQRKFQRPTFIKKSDRLAPPPHNTDQSTVSDSITPGPPSHSPSADPSQDSARRLAQAELLIKDKLERDAQARLLGKKAWDDDDDLDPDSLVDDTDDLDPAAEHAAWKLRELQRLKRDREAMIAREKEIEEIERRRNLTAEEREHEDTEFIDQQKQEKEASRSGTEAQYLARYHHKGAFFQGDEAAEILKRRNVMGAKFEDQVSDKSLLPEYMQLRDMTKLGKKGRTRYTDLKGQDTGRFGDDVKKWRGSSDYRGAGGGGGGGGQAEDLVQLVQTPVQLAAGRIEMDMEIIVLVTTEIEEKTTETRTGTGVGTGTVLGPANPRIVIPAVDLIPDLARARAHLVGADPHVLDPLSRGNDDGILMMIETETETETDDGLSLHEDMFQYSYVSLYNICLEVSWPRPSMIE